MNKNAYHVNVLDKGFVELQYALPHIGDDENVHLFQHITNAARTSYVGDTKGYEKDLKLLQYLWKNEHMTPFEMVRFQFRIKCPLVVQNQWVRHRSGSFNIQSYRYTEAQEDEFYIPETWRLQHETNKQGSTENGESISDLVCSENLRIHLNASMRAYNQALVYGVAREMARFYLPAYLLYSTMVWSVDFRNLAHFIDLREKDNAQYEIRQYALAIKEIIKSVSPELYELLGMKK